MHCPVKDGRIPAVDATRVGNWSLRGAGICDTDLVTVGDINDPSNPENKYRARESQGQQRELLMAWDPIGVCGVPEAADEYDCMLSRCWTVFTAA